MGNCNDLLSQNDKQGVNPHPNWLCNGFQEVVGDCDLTDIPLEGYPFTSTKSRGTPHMIGERLDRSLITSEWLRLFPSAKLLNLTVSRSDHSPILLCCHPMQSRHKIRSFKFENWWLEEEGVAKVVHDGWTAVANHSVVERIADCASDLERWNIMRVRQNKEERESIRAKLELYRGSNDLMTVAHYMEANNEYNKVLIREDTYWCQRAKTHWLRDNDLNTQFFQRSASNRQNFQKIKMLKDGAQVEIRDHEGMFGVAKRYFDTLFEARAGTYESVLNLVHPVITNVDNVLLIALVLKEELYEALIQMHPDKSPGPDGFNPTFYQNF
ncbi:uncharacterized protein LOC131597309 [Vicia villosa]|uniref:uncharacterized protein LOC131597309 n=1 Tax=Vicia villosa TaxID=3911 RepID=UPI00273BFE31|nr:uncharacterized protein LOC131597309 [Vicia villosa]